MARSLRQIVEDDRSNWQKSEECLASTSDLIPEDFEFAADLRAGAITFAIFALIEHLQDAKGEQV